MQWPSNKYRELAASLSGQLTETAQLLDLERAKRIAAETLAVERSKHIDELKEQLAASEKARNEAVTERMKSVDLVNTTLLGQFGPEKPPPDIKQFSKIPGRQQRGPLGRRMDAQFVMQTLKAQSDRKVAAPIAPAKPPIVQ